MFVWWISQADCELLLPKDVEAPFPEWLRDQLLSVRGRAGRGRLWVDKRFGTYEATWCASPLARHCAGCAGIVVDRETLPFLAQMPGVVTDNLLRRVGG